MGNILAIAAVVAVIIGIALVLTLTGSWLIAGALNAGAGTTFTTWAMFKLVLGLGLVGGIPVYAHHAKS